MVQIFYYNTNLNSTYGGGTHANEVYHALKRMEDVSVEGYPTTTESSAGGAASGRRSWRSAIAACLPRWLRLAREFWLKDYRQTIPDIQTATGETRVVFIRTNSRLSLLRYLKTQPQFALVCAEVNAIVSEEVPFGLPWRRLWVKWEIRQLKQADLIMVVSSYLKDRLAALGIEEQRILVNQNGANIELFDPGKHHSDSELRQSWGVGPDGFVFGYVGGMETFRRLPEVIAAFAEFASTEPRTHLVIIGQGSDLEKVKKRHSECSPSIRQRIHLAGIIPYTQVPQAMASFDCGIFPYSNPYGSPQKIFEYLAMGLPVLGPDVPVVTEVFEHSKHLRLAKQDGSNLQGLFHQAIQDQDDNRQMAACGQKLIVNHYTWDSNARRLVNFLKSHSHG